MRLLGAILAGGKSQRFGGDKAAALLDDKALIDHVSDMLAPQVDAVVVCGRQWTGRASIADCPVPGMGPLGGLNAALQHASHYGYDAVLTAGCDVLPVPDLRALVGPVAAVIDEQWLFGFWPVALAASLDAHLVSQQDRSIRHWIAVCGARRVACATSFHNFNTRDDFELYKAERGLAA